MNIAKEQEIIFRWAKRFSYFRRKRHPIQWSRELDKFLDEIKKGIK